ncbi:MAG TPA: NAD-dependent epimerase/dehydratase family protein, partial [Planctomycetaceae bacterium]|nr:NAD-dependent epimerase/dehydratase family protein [Planctomycetaceae bacterium]
MKALVTGGAGFLGRYIVEQLLARGDEVRILTRGDYELLRQMPVEVIRGDVRDLNVNLKACAGIETVFHTAAVPGIWGSWNEYYSNNTLGTERLLQASIEQGVRKFLYTSSPSVIFDSIDHINRDESVPYPSKYLCHYPHTKALAERHVLEMNGQGEVATCSIRPHLMWGPRDNHLVPRLLKRAKSRKLIRVGDGTNTISVIYVENAAAAHLQAADCLGTDTPVGGQAYFINETEPVNLWNWIAQILEVAELPPVRRHISRRTAYAIGTVMEGISRMLRLKSEPTMSRFLANQLSLSHTYRIDRAQRDFG